MTLHATRRTIFTVVLSAALVFGAFCAEAALATPGGDNISSAVVTATPLSVLGSVDASTTDKRDVFKIWLPAGKTLEASVDGTGTGLDLDLYLYGSKTTSIDEKTTRPVMWSAGETSRERFTYMAADAGYYYLDVHAFSGVGDYTLNARILPAAVPFSINWLTAPKKARKGALTRFAVKLTPAYNGSYSPVWFHFYRYEKGKYRKKAEKLATGYRTPGAASSELFYKYRFPKKGKWRVRAEFWDEAHKSKYTKYKVVTVR
jgi:hypothetical protein